MEQYVDHYMQAYIVIQWSLFRLELKYIFSATAVMDTSFMDQNTKFPLRRRYA